MSKRQPQPTQYSNKPLWILVAISAVSTILAVAALVLVLVSNNDRLTQTEYKVARIQYGLLIGRASRHQAAEDSCQLLTGMVNLAAGSNPAKKQEARQFLISSGLSDCGLYADRLTTVKPK